MNTEPQADTAPADPAAFALWVAPALVPMRRLARRLAPAADPDDVVQDALARAWHKRDHFDAARGTPITWLLAVVADQARTHRRSRARWLRMVDDTVEVPERAGVDTATDVDLDRAIAALARRQQLAVHLYYFLDLSIDECAAVMNCSPGTVKSTLHDARTRLRALLGDDNV